MRLHWSRLLVGIVGVAIFSAAIRAQDKKADPPRLTHETLEQFLTNALEDPRPVGTVGDSRFRFYLDKTVPINNTDYTVRVEVSLTSDRSTLWLGTRLADIPNAETIPSRELFALLQANDTLVGANYLSCSNAHIWLNRPLDARTLTPREFNRQLTDHLKVIAKTSKVWQVSQWPAPAGQQLVYRGHTTWVRSLAVTPDGKQILSGGDDKMVLLWDRQTGQEAARFAGHTDYVFKVALSPDGKKAVSASRDGTARLWDLSAKRELSRLVGHKHLVWCATFAPDGRQVATGGGFFPGNDGKPTNREGKPTEDLGTEIHLWDVDSGKEVARLEGHTNMVTSLAFSPDGKFLVSSSNDGTVRLWDLADRKEVRQFGTGKNGVVAAVIFSRDGRTVIAGGADRLIRVWDTDSGKEVMRLEGHTSNIWCLALSSDGKHLLSSGHDRGTRLWNLASGKRLAILGGHHDSVTSVAFTPDGNGIVTSSNDSTVRVWALPR